MNNSVEAEELNLKKYQDEDEINRLANHAMDLLKKHKDFQGIFNDLDKDLVTRIVNKNMGTSGNTLLHYAVLYNAERAAEELLKVNANVNADNNGRMKPLHCVRNKKMARLLCKYGADVNAVDNANNSILGISIRNENMDLYHFILKEKRNQNKKKKNSKNDHDSEAC